MLYNLFMQIIHELSENPNLSLALGYFDGVHLGHQAVIKKAVEFAKQKNIKSAVITFKDHPCCYFRGVCPKYILTREYREKFIADLGIDYLYELDFEKLANLSAEEYLKDILIKYFRPQAISTGFNHYFGHNKTGNVEFLKSGTATFGYEFTAIPPQKYAGEVISSTKIRNLLSYGNIELANNMLGRNFIIKGVVIKGQQIGRTIGFRTANLVYPPELIDLPFGVYSVIVNYNSKQYKGIANFGVRPTVNGSGALLEVHILDFDKDIYGETLEVEFRKMIRREQKFESLDTLKQQIKSDIKSII